MKKVRSADTVTGAVKDFLDVAKGLPDVPPHVKLRAKDRPYWNSIVMHRARDEWTDTELVAAGQLARTQADIATWMEQLEGEPAVLEVGPNDIPRPNPLLRIIEEATRRELALFRMLGLSTPTGREKIVRRQRLHKAGRDVNAAEGAPEGRHASVDDLLA